MFVSESYFTISDFAHLMGISRQTLIYYDRIGLFHPIKTLDNQYRLYSRNQINVISLICMLKEMNVPLNEIKTIVENISPDTALAILEKKQQEAEEKRRRFQILEEMIHLRIEQITLGKEILNAPPPAFSIIEVKEKIPLYLGQAINCPQQSITDDMYIDFYAECEAKSLPLIFSGGQMKRKEDIIAGRTDIVSHMCFSLKDTICANGAMPKGKYAVGYACGNCQDNADSYKKLLSFIKENSLQIIGNAYEEYLLDELSESHPRRFVMKIMIQVA